MSSEPSERAKRWLEERNGLSRLLLDRTAPTQAMADRMFAYDAGYSEGEKRGAAAGHLATLQAVKAMCDAWSNGAEVRGVKIRISGERALVNIAEWVDRRIVQAEEDANG